MAREREGERERMRGGERGLDRWRGRERESEGYIDSEGERRRE